MEQHQDEKALFHEDEKWFAAHPGRRFRLSEPAAGSRP
jgi:hypothetical protein